MPIFAEEPVSELCRLKRKFLKPHPCQIPEDDLRKDVDGVATSDWGGG